MLACLWVCIHLSLCHYMRCIWIYVCAIVFIYMCVDMSVCFYVGMYVIVPMSGCERGNTHQLFSVHPSQFSCSERWWAMPTMISWSHRNISNWPSSTTEPWDPLSLAVYWFHCLQYHRRPAASKFLIHTQPCCRRLQGIEKIWVMKAHGHSPDVVPCPQREVGMMPVFTISPQLLRRGLVK